MNDAGFEFVPLSFSEPTVVDAAAVFGTDDVRHATSEGFAELDGLVTPATEVPDGVPTEVPSGYNEALTGTASEEQTFDVPGGQIVVPGGGCYYESTASLFDEPTKYFQYQSIVNNIDNTAISIVLADPQVGAAFGLYQQCMSERGFADMVAPDEAPGMAAQLIEDGEPVDGRRVKELAVSDATCNAEAALLQTAQPLLREARAQVAEDLGPILAEYQAMIATAAAKVTDADK